MIKFTIYGNQTDPKGNPIPYFRQTQGSKWSKGAIRYQQWKQHVFYCYLQATQKFQRIDASKQKHRMDIMIYYSSMKHADSDNIFKGVADALFSNDKLVCGSFDFDYDKLSPRVEVTIYPMAS